MLFRSAPAVEEHDLATGERTLDLKRHNSRLTRDDVRNVFLHGLSHQERLLAILWYVERMTPHEIALALDTTVVRVHDDHAQIIQKLG